MDPMSMMQVPQELMEDAISHVHNPLAFGGLLPQILGEDGADFLVRSVICSVAEYLVGDDVQRLVEQRIDHETQGDLLPVHPYDRQNVVAAVTDALLYTIGVR